MYTKNEGECTQRDPFIPSNYRGNALYFEYPKQPEEEKTECLTDRDDKDSDDGCSEKEPCRSLRRDGSFFRTLLNKISDPEILPILLLVAFLFFSGKGGERRAEEDGTLLIVLLLLLL